MGKDYYTLLGVGRDANEQELKKSEADQILSCCRTKRHCLANKPRVKLKVNY